MSFDKYSELDPAKMLRDINEAVDPDIPFDQFSLLDPERARRQLSDAGYEVSNAAMLDPARFQSEIETALLDGGGGGGDDEFVLQLGSDDLQLGSQELTLGEA